MRHLFLHIGMHKTGTTSIQRTLFDAREALQDAGYSYFDAEANHSHALFGGFTEAPEDYHVHRRLGLHRREDALAHAAAARERLLGFVRDAPGPALILSGEDAGMLSPDATAAMLAAFRPLVDRITVLGFVRPPRAFLTSAFQEVVLGGGGVTLGMRGNAPRYRFRFEKYKHAPEVAETRLRLYTREALPDGCSVAGFLALCGAPPELRERIEVVRANPSGSRLSVVLALAANEAVPVFREDGGPNPERTPSLRHWLKDLDGPRFALPAALLGPALEAAREDIAWMEAALGHPFPEEDPERPDAADDFRTLAWEETRALALAVNRLVRERDDARRALAAARRGAAAAARAGGGGAGRPGPRRRP